MQEAVEEKTINLAVSMSKLSWRAIVGAVRAYIAYKRHKEMMGAKRYRGKQTVKQLISQDQGVTSMVVGDESIKQFERIAKRYGVDFAITKDKFSDPPKYTAFFKAKDLDALEAVMDEFEKTKAFDKQKPSVLEKLDHFKEVSKEQITKAKIRVKEMVR